MNHIKGFLTVFAVSAVSFSAQATTLSLVNSGQYDGHYYELLGFTDAADGRLDWNQAKTYAETLSFNGKTGHLATLTSAAEDDFVWSLGAEGYFLGAYDTSTQDSAGKWEHHSWQWVTGETVSYGNWMPGEPNHWQDGSDSTANNEDFLAYGWKDRGADLTRWNDTNVDSAWMDGAVRKYTTQGFVVEYTPVAGSALTAVPVPAAVWLFASGLLGVLGVRGKKRAL